MSYMPTRKELDTWIEQGSKLIKAARTREDALASYRSQQWAISHWHEAVARGALKRLAEAGRSKFR